MHKISIRNCVLAVFVPLLLILFSACSIPTIDLDGLGNGLAPNPLPKDDWGFGQLNFTKCTYVAVYDSLEMEPINGAECSVESVSGWCFTDSTFVTGEHGIVNIVIKFKYPDTSEWWIDVSAKGYISRRAKIVFDTDTDLILLQPK